eukprot:scaffold47977_cov40-Phaeocystis_antarctica.AAC.1
MSAPSMRLCPCVERFCARRRASSTPGFGFGFGLGLGLGFGLGLTDERGRRGARGVDAQVDQRGPQPLRLKARARVRGSATRTTRRPRCARAARRWAAAPRARGVSGVSGVGGEGGVSGEGGEDGASGVSGWVK